jgi:hypothetical protein
LIINDQGSSRLTPESSERDGRRDDCEEDEEDGGQAHDVEPVNDVAPVLGVTIPEKRENLVLKP